MTIDEMRQKAREAVNAADFQSSLPAGECDGATVSLFLDRRRKEIVAAARRALNDHACVIHPEAILRLLYGEVSEEEFAVLTAV